MRKFFSSSRFPEFSVSHFCCSLTVYRPPALRAFNDTTNALVPPNTSDPNTSDTPASTKTRTRRPDRAVYVPRARRSQTTPPSTNKDNQQEPTFPVPPNHSSPNNNDEVQNHASEYVVPTSPTSSVAAAITETTPASVIPKTLRKSESIDESTLQLNSCGTMAPKGKLNVKIIDDNKKVSPKKDDDGEKEERELRKASQEMNRATKRIIKQTFNSNVLEIDAPPSQKHEKNKLKEQKSLNPEEDDWEAMFDDNGECLDPNLLDELTAQVGKVTIEKPKTDYKVKI